jgi:ribosomal protein S18 acetylase RimI-like enzyme
MASRDPDYDGNTPMASSETTSAISGNSAAGPLVTTLDRSPQTVATLAEIMVDVVAGGASVHFLHPLALSDATAFWEQSFAAAARGERIVFGGLDGGVLVATVTLQLACPPNQPHRGEIAKMMTRRGHRGRGIATRLLHAAEARAIAEGRTLLVLDTAVDDGASGLYERLGYTEAGVIPDYAYRPHGELTGTRYFYKRIGAAAPRRMS